MKLIISNKIDGSSEVIVKCRSLDNAVEFIADHLYSIYEKNKKLLVTVQDEDTKKFEMKIEWMEEE